MKFLKRSGGNILGIPFPRHCTTVRKGRIRKDDPGMWRELWCRLYISS